jgi:hypothetical protein
LKCASCVGKLRTGSLTGGSFAQVASGFSTAVTAEHHTEKRKFNDLAI